MKLLEAMAMERIVLVSDVEMIAEVEKDSQSGVLFREGDTNAFIRKIKMLLDISEDKRRTIASQARKSVSQEYTWERAQEQLNSIYSEVMENRCKQSGIAD